jgi:hypothetical protein
MIRSRPLTALLALLILTAAACGDDQVIDSTTTTVPDSSTTTSTVPETTSTTTSQTTVVEGGALEEDIRALVLETERIRGLEFLSPPDVAIVSADELADRVRTQIEEELDPDEIIIDEAFFELLGILDPEIDLAQALTDLYAEQVAGFYDNDTRELVIGGDTELTPLTELIVVHELIHALTDQHFDFASTLDTLVEEERYHEASAIQALAEGDATYFEILYLQGLSAGEQLEAVAESLEADMTVLDSLPEWFGLDILFPYDQGFVFVERLVAGGGIAGLDQAYRLLPETTEQILHPDLYFALEPGRDVSLPANALLPGYDVYEDGEFGEWNVRLYLLDGAPAGEAVIGSAGWGGDAYRILWDGTEVAFLYRFEGDTPRDAVELEEALVESIGNRMAVGSPSVTGPEDPDEDGPTVTRFGGEDYAWVLRDGPVLLFVAASDPEAGEALTEAMDRPAP